MSTGSPSSPAAANTGASRSSSGSTRAPLSSRMPSPRSFQILRPRAPASRERRRLSTSTSGVEARAPDGAQVDVAERDEAAGVRAVVAVEVALQLVAPEAVQVDDRLDVHLVEQSRSARRRRRPPRGARRRARARPGRAPASRPRGRASARGGCARRPPARAAAGRPCSGSTSRDCGSQSSSSRAHSLMQAARWPAGGLELRVDGAAGVVADRAAGMEAAAGRDVDRVRRLALQDLRPAPVVRVAPRHDRDQRPGVRVLRVADHAARRPFLDDAAEVHDQDAVGVLRGGREVVRDHEDAEPAARGGRRAGRGCPRAPTRRASRPARRRRAASARARARRRSRRAAAGRPRARAGSGRGRARPGRARRARAPRARARVRSAREPMPWITSGSPTVSRTR